MTWSAEASSLSSRANLKPAIVHQTIPTKVIIKATEVVIEGGLDGALLGRNDIKASSHPLKAGIQIDGRQFFRFSKLTFFCERHRFLRHLKLLYGLRL